MKRILIATSLLALAACFDSDSDSKAKVSLSFQPVLSSSTASSSFIANRSNMSMQPRVAANDCSDADNFPAYKTSYGASGAPDDMTLYLKSIVLSSQDSGKTATLFESSTANGDAISISNANGGTISLAALAAAIEAEVDEEGNSIETEIPTGTFNQLAVTFRNEADIKGCIEEVWGDIPQGTSGNECDETSGEACNTLVGGNYKVCTGVATNATTSDPITIFDLVTTAGAAAASSVTDQAQFSDYVGTAATQTQVNLNIRGNDENFTRTADATFNVDVPTVTLGDGDSINLTLAFDMNLLLRFEGNVRYQRGNGDATQNGDFHPLADTMNQMNGSKDLDAAYFHTSYLPDVMAVYLGEPGTVEGYEVTSCYQFNDNGTLVDNDFRTVESWMTMIFDTDGDLVTGITTPKDDAGMVIVKGSINELDASTRPSIKNTDGSYNLLFGEQVFSGAINNWTRLSAVGNEGTLSTDDVEQTVISSAGVANRIVPTWNYERKL
ncbi:MAG: hypothetical protein ACI8SR_001193 [Oceanicoccus sp.]|jgi:hypothetical protein